MCCFSRSCTKWQRRDRYAIVLAALYEREELLGVLMMGWAVWRRRMAGMEGGTDSRGEDQLANRLEEACDGGGAVTESPVSMNHSSDSTLA